MTAARSAGSGALAENSTPVSGHTKLNWCACRNMRLRPAAFMRSLNSASPYFSSPASGYPACVACTRIWWVRPVSSDDFHQRRLLAEELHRLEHAGGLLAGGMRLHRSFSAHANIRAQRHVDAFLAELPLALHQREVAFLHLPLAQQRVQRAQRRGLARHQQQAAGIAIEAMHQLEIFIGTRGAQRFDHAEAHATATVHSHPGRLVDDQQLWVLVHDGAGDALQQCAGRAPRRCLRAGSHRRHAHDVVRQQPRLGLGALAVHAHLALANHAENMGPGHILEDSRQKVVEPLSCAALVDGDLRDLGRHTGRFQRSLWRRNVGRFVTSCFH